MACDHGQLRQVWVICPRELPSPSQLSWKLPAASQPSPPVAIQWLFLLFQSARFPCCTPAALFQGIRLPEGFHPPPLRRRGAGMQGEPGQGSRDNLRQPGTSPWPAGSSGADTSWTSPSWSQHRVALSAAAPTPSPSQPHGRQELLGGWMLHCRLPPGLHKLSRGSCRQRARRAVVPLMWVSAGHMPGRGQGFGWRHRVPD